MLDTTNPMFLMGALVAIASAGFFSLRYFRPTASREYDVVFAIVGFIYAVTLMWEGWRLIPLLAFAQLLLVGTSAFFAVESFRLRMQLTERARQSSGGGPGPSRRARGFTRTYQGDDYDSRQVEGRIRNRMRDTSDEDSGPRRRKLRSANGPRPRLASSSETRRSSRRPRPGQPTRDRFDDGDFNDSAGRYGDADYSDESGRDDYPTARRPGRRPGRSRPSRPIDEGFDPREDVASGSAYDRGRSGELFDDESFPDEPRVSRRSRSRTASRRPPRMPDDVVSDEGFVDEGDLNPPVRSLDVEDYGSDYGDEGFEGSY
ncbi:MAG: Ycf66 family protein [Cyanobacteria bacterium P01_A01_bin.3]